jgi:hypothetical protein
MRFVEKFHKSKILLEETEMYSNDDNWWGLILLFGFCFSLMGMLLFADGQGYKKGVNETLVLCMEKPKDCKIKYDYLKLENQK